MNDYYDDNYYEVSENPAESVEVFKKTPWFAISLAFHALLLLAIWSVVLAEVTALVPVSAPTAVEPPKLPEPPKILPQTIMEEERNEEEIEDPTEDPRIIEDAFDDHNEDPTNDPMHHDLRPNPNPDRSNVESPYPAQGFNSSVGLGGNLGGGGGPGGMGGFVYRRARGGGGQPGDRNVLSALVWLEHHQDIDGSWSPETFPQAGAKHGRSGSYNNLDGTESFGWPQNEVGISGLATLAFLGAGYTHREGRFQRTVRNALRYLKQVQDNDGCFGPRDDHHFVYNHAICSMAMSEGYAMTGSAMLRGPAQKSVDFIADCQNMDPDRGYLGWRYGVAPGDSDASVTGWMVLALKSARVAGLTVPERCWEGANRIYEDLTVLVNGYPKTGYITRGGPNARLRSQASFDNNASMDAINVLARLFMGESRTNGDLQSQAARMCEPDGLPSTSPNKLDYYYWYYASLALFQMGGRYWREWETPMINALTSTQRLEGGESVSTYGSWDSNSAWGVAGSRVYATAINCLTLEVYYRYEFMGTSREE
jgi:hypothetical protein